MSLNEFLKEHRTEEQKAMIARQQKQIERLLRDYRR